jgi:hypothetical protein
LGAIVVLLVAGLLSGFGHLGHGHSSDDPGVVFERLMRLLIDA